MKGLLQKTKSHIFSSKEKELRLLGLQLRLKTDETQSTPNNQCIKKGEKSDYKVY